MEKEGWRILAIVFMIVSFLAFISLIGFYKIGVNELEREANAIIELDEHNEEECKTDICIYPEVYHYDEEHNVCYCFNNGEVTYSGYMD